MLSMFTGIIKEMGTVRALIPNATGARLIITAHSVLQNANIGDSIAVNGCCLTIVHLDTDRWEADVISETLTRTCLGDLKVGDPVNLEAAMCLGDRFGGHWVQGHVDGIGILSQKLVQPDNSTLVTIQCANNILRYMVEKGSITVDGISLTVVAVDTNAFSFAMIPHTSLMTTLGWKQSGTKVNLEIDILAKYVEKLTVPLIK